MERAKNRKGERGGERVKLLVKKKHSRSEHYSDSPTMHGANNSKSEDSIIGRNQNSLRRWTGFNGNGLESNKKWIAKKLV